MDLVREIADAGLFKMAVPASRGGGGADLRTVLLTIEEVSRADGSTGWCVAQGVNTFRNSLQLREDVDDWLDDPERRAALLRAIARVETEPSILGASSHLLAVARR